MGSLSWETFVNPIETGNFIKDDPAGAAGVFGAPDPALMMTAAVAYDNKDSIKAWFKGDDAAKPTPGGDSGAEEVEAVDYEAMYSSAAKYAKITLAAQIDAAKQLLNYNIDKLPLMATTAFDESMNKSGQMDAVLTARFIKTLNDIDPNWEARTLGTERASKHVVTDMAQLYAESMLPALSKNGTIASEMVESRAAQLQAAQIPSDVSARVMQSVGARTGVRALTARDLGTTSRQLELRGTDFATLGQALRGSVLGTVSGGLNILQVPAQTAAMYGETVKTFVGPQSDPGALYANTLSQITGQNMISPTVGLQTAASLYSSALNSSANVAMSNQSAAWSRATTDQQVANATWATTQQLAMAKQQNTWQQRQQLYQTVAMAAGAYAGWSGAGSGSK